MFLHAFSDGIVSVYESFFLVTVYIIYVSLVLGQYIWRQRSDQNYIRVRDNPSETSPSDPYDGEVEMLVDEETGMMMNNLKEEDAASVTNNNNNNGMESSNHTEACIRISHRIHYTLYTALGIPIEQILRIIVPSLHPVEGWSCRNIFELNAEAREFTESTRNKSPNTRGHQESASLLSTESHLIDNPVSIGRTVAVLISCICYIGLFASCIIILCTEITTLLNIHNGTVGATLIALGSEVSMYYILYIITLQVISHNMYCRFRIQCLRSLYQRMDIMKRLWLELLDLK